MRFEVDSREECVKRDERKGVGETFEVDLGKEVPYSSRIRFGEFELLDEFGCGSDKLGSRGRRRICRFCRGSEEGLRSS